MSRTRPGAATLNESIAAVRLDRDGRIADVTVEAASMLGYARDALHTLTLRDLAAEQWLEMADGATARILCGDTTPFQLMLCGLSGRRTLVQMVSRRIEQHGEPSYVLVWSELTPRYPPESMQADSPELRRLAYGLLRTLEDERSRVAADLHSGVAPLVVMVKFMVEDAMQRVLHGAHTQGLEVLDGAVGRLREVLDEVRRISMELRPSLLDDLGLLPTIEWFCRTFEQTYRAIRVERVLAVNEVDLPEHLKLDMFRIVQEALANVAQHSSASLVRVALRREADELKLCVQDDGVGFDIERHVYRDDCSLGLGLPSIRKRVEATSGRLVLESKPQGGSMIGAAWALPSRAAVH